jgi:hypothetical protein
MKTFLLTDNTHSEGLFLDNEHNTKQSDALVGKIRAYDGLSPLILSLQTVKEFLLVRRAKMRYSNKRVR